MYQYRDSYNNVVVIPGDTGPSTRDQNYETSYFDSVRVMIGGLYSLQTNGFEVKRGAWYHIQDIAKELNLSPDIASFW